MKTCTKCGIRKELTEYYFHTLRGKYKPQSMCKSCHIAMVTKYKTSHRIIKLKVIKPPKINLRKIRKHEKYKRLYMVNKEKFAIYSKKRRILIKTEVLTHYGNNECKCVKCGFGDIRALSIDHINGNGAEHRKENKNVRGNHVYEWLRKNKFPEGYQTLCMNCQLIKRQENQEYRFKKKEVAPPI